jgi:hypothetical protein
VVKNFGTVHLEDLSGFYIFSGYQALPIFYSYFYIELQVFAWLIMYNQHTLQRRNTENSKQIFPERKLRGFSPNFHIHVSARDLYNPRDRSSNSAAGNIKYVDRFWEYITIYNSLTETCTWKLGLRQRTSFSGNT